MIHELNDYIKEVNPFIKFIIKPFNEPLKLDMSPVPKTQFDITIFNLIDEYAYKKEYFERYVLMTMKPLAYVVINDDRKVINIYSAEQLKQAFGHLKVKRDGFIAGLDIKWIQDDEKLVYDNFVYLPSPIKSSVHDFNALNPWIIIKTPLQNADCDTWLA